MLNVTVPSVELVIPPDQFIDAMHNITEWLAEQRITSPCATCRRERASELNFCIAFPTTSQAVRFARRFGGRRAG